MALPPGASNTSAKVQYYLNSIYSKCVLATGCPAGTGVVSGTPSIGVCVGCTNPAALSCSGTGTGKDLTCKFFNGTQYALSSGTCVSSCPSAYYKQLIAGNFVCSSCALTGVASCTATTPGSALSCGLSGSQYYLTPSGTCVLASACPSSYGNLVVSLGTCGTCSDPGALICSASGTGKSLTCGIVGGVQQILLSGSCVAACPTTGYFQQVVSGSSVCTACALGALTCTSTTSLTCGLVSGNQYYMTPSSTCVTQGNCPSTVGSVNTSTQLVLCTPCTNPAATACAGLASSNVDSNCGIIGGVQYYLRTVLIPSPFSIRKNCVVQSACLASLVSTKNGILSCTH